MDSYQYTMCISSIILEIYLKKKTGPVLFLHNISAVTNSPKPHRPPPSIPDPFLHEVNPLSHRLCSHIPTYSLVSFYKTDCIHTKSETGSLFTFIINSAPTVNTSVLHHFYLCLSRKRKKLKAP